MTHEEKMQYMRIASSICGFGFTDDQIDLMVSLYDSVTEKQGETNLKDIILIQALVDKRKIEREMEKLLNSQKQTKR